MVGKLVVVAHDRTSHLDIDIEDTSEYATRDETVQVALDAEITVNGCHVSAEVLCQMDLSEVDHIAYGASYGGLCKMLSIGI